MKGEDSLEASSKIYEQFLPGLRDSSRIGSRLGDIALALNDISCSDLNSVLVTLSAEKASDVIASDLINGNKYHQPSPVDPRVLHDIEKEFYEQGTDIKFIDLSPLQPFGINQFLTGTSEKKIVAALRGSEVNADPTTALFRLAFKEINPNRDTVRLGTHSRSVRAQNFGENSKFLQQFKTFSEVTVGKQSERFGLREIESIVDHLGYEFDCIRNVLPQEKLRVYISNLIFTEELMGMDKVNLKLARSEMRNYSSADYSEDPEAFSLSGLDSTLDNLHITKGRRVLEMFFEILSERRPDLLNATSVDLNRVAGLGYYRHVCYKIISIRKDGEPFPLADGGSTNWAQRVGSNKQIYTVASGVGTEMIAKNFKEESHD